MTLLSVAVFVKKGRATLSKLFHVINSDNWQSEQVNGNASIVKRTKENDFTIVKC